jgi:hypothetical protein
MLASLGLRWWQHMIVRGLKEPCISAEVNGCRKLSLYQGFTMSIRAYHSLQIAHKKMSDKIAFAMAINTAQRKKPERLGIACRPPPPPSPNHLYVAFSRSSSLDDFAFVIIDRTSTANIKWQIHNIKQFISRSALKFQIYIYIIRYFIVSTHEIFAQI